MIRGISEATLVWILVMVAAPEISLAKGAGHGVGGGFRMNGIIVYLGIATLISVLATFITGRLMPKKRQLLYPWHRRLGTIAVILALIHGTLAFFVH